MPPRRRTTTTPGLTLGVLFSGLRQAMTRPDTGSRISIVFEQRTELTPTGDSDQASRSLVSRRSLHAELDFDSAGLQRADVRSAGMSSSSHARICFARQGKDFLYSVDGIHFGPFAGAPDLFDVENFERALDFIAVSNVTIEQVRNAGQNVEIDALDIDVDRAGFVGLLRVFGDDTANTAGDLKLTEHTLHLTAGGDLVMDYWWQLSGGEVDEEDPTLSYDCRINCHVTLRLLQLSALPLSMVDVDAALPELDQVDDVWAAVRDNVSNPVIR